MKDLINTILAEIDNASALGAASRADTLGAVLVTLASAAEARGFAMQHRLAGRIDTALHWETIAESYVREAHVFGEIS
jgi:hypothetical protein